MLDYISGPLPLNFPLWLSSRLSSATPFVVVPWIVIQLHAILVECFAKILTIILAMCYVIFMIYFRHFHQHLFLIFLRIHTIYSCSMFFEEDAKTGPRGLEVLQALISLYSIAEPLAKISKVFGIPAGLIAAGLQPPDSKMKTRYRIRTFYCLRQGDVRLPSEKKTTWAIHLNG